MRPRTVTAGAVLTGLLVFAAAAPAFAHEVAGQAHGFLTGLRHPLSGLDHVLAMIAVGLWGAQLGQPAVWLLPVTFPMVMAFGGFLALLGVPLAGIEVGIALSAVLLGLMVAADAKPPLVAAALLVGVFAIFHGHAHGTELPPGQNGLTYSIGFVVATGGLHAVASWGATGAASPRRRGGSGRSRRWESWRSRTTWKSGRTPQSTGPASASPASGGGASSTSSSRWRTTWSSARTR